MANETDNKTGPKLVSDNSVERSQIIDISQVRAQKLEEKRKSTERVFFRKLLSVYSVATTDSMIAIDLIEVSEDGCSFQVPYDANRPWPNELTGFPLRLYFSQDSFLEIPVQIQNTRHAIENHQRYIRVGCSVDTQASTYPTYLAFVNFLKLYSAQCGEDKGGIQIFYL